MNLNHGSTTVRYVHTLIAPTARPEDTLVLRLYGNKHDRQDDLTDARQTIHTPHNVQHIWWPWHRTPRLLRPQPTLPRLKATNTDKTVSLITFAASMFTIGAAIYHIATGQP